MPERPLLVLNLLQKHLGPHAMLLLANPTKEVALLLLAHLLLMLLQLHQVLLLSQFLLCNGQL